MTMRKRCQILHCIEMVEGTHFSHNLLCCYRIAASTLNFAFELRIPHSPTPTGHPIPHPTPPSTRQTNSNQTNMPRLRHRMRCRRGSSRGRVTRPPLLSLLNSIPSDSSTPSTTAHFTSQCPATRSGWGCAQTACSKHATNSHQPPNASVSMMQPYHSTQFQFRCTLECPCIIVAIFVAFREEP